MKRALLVFCFIVVAMTAYSQRSFNEQLSLVNPRNSEKVDITIFPNPATTHIGLSDPAEVEKILIFNLAGRQMKLFEITESDNRFYIGDLPRGMYLVQVLGRKNEILTTKRVSKR